MADWFEAREPMYIYFHDYARMAGEGNVRELLTKRQNSSASPTRRGRSSP
ncbi:MAG: hypothetical protein ACSLFR_15265 [Solirubrobacteraceae bacterium]